MVNLKILTIEKINMQAERGDLFEKMPSFSLEFTVIGASQTCGESSYSLLSFFFIFVSSKRNDLLVR